MNEFRELAWPVGIAIGAYVLITYALGFAIREKVHTSDDFIVAGRRLPLSLAWATLLATWFGAGTMLTAADEVRSEGLRVTALEPLGSGLCLLLAGLFLARRLWEMRLLTMSDFFARRFGPRAELLSAFVMVPGYFGWIAVQFIALAGMLELFLGLDLQLGIALVAVVGMGYTLLGGMWAVTLTDALQLGLLLVGLLILGVSVLHQLGDGALLAGFIRLGDELPPSMLDPVPTETATAFAGWVSVLAVAALGNLPGQDLLQRIFSARSAGVARNACLIAGVTYVAFGAIPVLLGLAAGILLPESHGQAIVPALAHSFLNPALAVVFTVALASAVMSTIDSAILSPSSVLAQNVLPRLVGDRVSSLALNRACVVGVTGASLTVAYIGEDAYELLEAAYELGLVGLFVPLAFGLYRTPRSEMPALVAMGTGTSLWLLHLVLGWETFLQPWSAVQLPASLAIVGILALLYLLTDRHRGPMGSA